MRSVSNDLTDYFPSSVTPTVWLVRPISIPHPKPVYNLWLMNTQTLLQRKRQIQGRLPSVLTCCSDSYHSHTRKDRALSALKLSMKVIHATSLLLLQCFIHLIAVCSSKQRLALWIQELKIITGQHSNCAVSSFCILVFFFLPLNLSHCYFL